MAIEFDAQSGATSGPDLSDRVVGGHIPSRRSRSAHWKDRRSFIVSQGFATSLTNVRIYPSLRLVAILPHFGFRRGVTGMKLRAIVTAMMIALTTPAFADISDYESMHRRLADVLGSRAQADAAYDKLMKEANTYGQPIDSVVDLFIAVCTASDECNP